MSDGATPGSADGPYERLACQRAGRARAVLSQQVSVERLFAESAAALEDAAGVLLHAATAFIASKVRCRGCSSSRRARSWRWPRGSRRPRT